MVSIRMQILNAAFDKSINVVIYSEFQNSTLREYFISNNHFYYAIYWLGNDTARIFELISQPCQNLFFTVNNHKNTHLIINTHICSFIENLTEHLLH